MEDLQEHREGHHSGEARKKLGTETETVLKAILGIEDGLKKCA